MQYRDYGKTRTGRSEGIKVSALGFGCMRLPMQDGHVVEAEAIRMLRHAIDNGVNYVDTAYGYCASESEIVVGKALKDGYRERVLLSTKNPCREDDPKRWREILEDQLRKLDVEWIDCYHFHGLNWDTWEKAVSKSPIAEMHRAKDEGLIRHIVFSFHDKPENLAKLVDTGEFAGITVQYNLLDRSNEEGIAYAAERGLVVVVMGPVGGGRLGEPSPEIQKLIPGGARSTAEAAMRFVLANPNVSVALSGMSTMQQVEENLVTAARTEPLSDAEREAVSASLAEQKRLADLYCTGCNYCMPCPNDVDIPANFRLMNYYRVYGLLDHARREYARLERKKIGEKVLDVRADSCLQCGECEPKCPQNIPITDQIEETRAALSV